MSWHGKKSTDRLYVLVLVLDLQQQKVHVARRIHRKRARPCAWQHELQLGPFRVLLKRDLGCLRGYFFK